MKAYKIIFVDSMRRFFCYFLLFFAFTTVCSAQDKPANPAALELFIEGKTLELQDNYLGAVEKYSQALNIEKAPGIYFALSRLYYNTSQYQKALDFALLAMKSAPDNTGYKENAADDYIMLNDYKNALSLLKEVSEQRPEDINVLY